MARRPSPGQPHSFVAATTAQLDLKTGEATFINRDATRFLDVKYDFEAPEATLKRMREYQVEVKSGAKPN
jgi:hypothetical protein